MTKRGGMGMNSKQIESFLCVAENLNISTSAQKLFASQSTISRQISLLEEELGMQLFIRGNNYLQLTPAGMMMYHTFKEIDGLYSNKFQEAQMLNQGYDGLLRIGLYSFMRIEIFFEDVMKRFHERYPSIRLEYECLPDGAIDTYVTSNVYDLVFLHGFDVIENADFLCHSVYKANQFLLYGASHPLAGAKDLKFADFRNEVFWSVKDRRGKKYLENKEKIFCYYGIDSWKDKEAFNIDTVLFNVSMGNGCCFLDSCTVMLNNKLYRKIFLAEEVGSVDINIAWNKNNMNPALPLLLEMLI